jgi:hypothetical protein
MAGTLFKSTGAAVKARVDARPDNRPAPFRKAPATRSRCRLASRGELNPDHGPSCVYRDTGSNPADPTGRESVHVFHRPDFASQK